MQTGARSARQLVRDASEELRGAGVPEPTACAEVLLAELLDVRRSELAILEGPLTDQQAMLYESWISRRKKREPVQRILGYTYFRKVRLELDEHTLIARPDTESVVDAALEAIDHRSGSCLVLDVGTGSGAIAVAIAQERAHCDVLATDSSEGALKVARRNAACAGVNVHFYRTDLVSDLKDLTRSVDVFVSNPPYVNSAQIPELAPEVRNWEPHTALDGGPDGTDFYRRIFTEAIPLLADGADVFLEVGEGQAETVLELGRHAGYIPMGTYPDLAGMQRVVQLGWSSL